MEFLASSLGVLGREGFFFFSPPLLTGLITYTVPSGQKWCVAGIALCPRPVEAATPWTALEPGIRSGGVAPGPAKPKSITFPERSICPATSSSGKIPPMRDCDRAKADVSKFRGRKHPHQTGGALKVFLLLLEDLPR